MFHPAKATWCRPTSFGCVTADGEISFPSFYESTLYAWNGNNKGVCPNHIVTGTAKCDTPAEQSSGQSPPPPKESAQGCSEQDKKEWVCVADADEDGVLGGYDSGLFCNKPAEGPQGPSGCLWTSKIPPYFDECEKYYDEVKAPCGDKDKDTDGDDVLDKNDNCPLVSNTNQQDTDGGGKGDVCDDDMDNDGTANEYDASPFTADNPMQTYWVVVYPQFFVESPTWPGWQTLKPSVPGASGAPADTDNDGTSDIDELTKYHTNPVKADSDGDGLSDTEEIKSGGNPTYNNAPVTIVAIAVTSGMLFEQYEAPAANITTPLMTTPTIAKKITPWKVLTTKRTKDVGNAAKPPTPQGMQQKVPKP